MKQVAIVLLVLLMMGCPAEQQRTTCSEYNVDIVVQRGGWGHMTLWVKCSRVATPTKFADFQVFEAFCERKHYTYVILAGGAI